MSEPLTREQRIACIVRTLRPADPGSWEANMVYVTAEFDSYDAAFGGRRPNETAPEGEGPDMTTDALTPNERVEHRILCLKSEKNHKFAIAIGYPLTQPEQDAMERLMLRDWIRLIDVTNHVPIAPGAIMRIFRVMPEALQWLHRLPIG